MRHLVLAAAVALGPALGPAVAGARPLADPPPWVLPVNVLAKAKVGDWTLLEGEAVLNGKRVTEREIVRVGALKGGVAQLELFEGPAGSEAWFLTFPVDVKRGPDTNLLYDLPWIAGEPTIAPASCTLGDTTFDCTEIGYQTPSHQVTVRMAARVRGSGLVSFTIVRDGKPTWTMHTIGYGTAGKVEWGAGPPRADLEAWDGGAQPTRLREGTQPATGDVYETAAEVARAMAPHGDLTGCQVDGGVRERDLRRMLERKLTAIDDCYGDAIATDRRAGGGAVELRFRLEAGTPADVSATGSCAPAATCVSDAVSAMELGEDADAKVTCTFRFDPGRRIAGGARASKPRLVTRAHPARGGPDLRGVQRIP